MKTSVKEITVKISEPESELKLIEIITAGIVI
jgi:hypothetical protein